MQHFRLSIHSFEQNSIPSVVFAEASWYGSIRTGIESNSDNHTGVADFSSRWGIKGSAEAAEGLTAVYRYERKLDSTDANDPGGRLSYVGLSGGFGTVTVGQVWGAPYNHFGGIVDQALNYGGAGQASYRFGDALSYAVSVGNVSMQADAIMNQDTKKTGDAFNFGATIGGIGETGKIAIAHRRHADSDKSYPGRGDSAVATKSMLKQSSSFVAGSYGIGDMTVFLGYSQDSLKDAGCTSTALPANKAITAGDSLTDAQKATNAANMAFNEGNNCFAKKKVKTTYAGVHGGVGDTGIGYVFTVRTEKGDESGFGHDPIKGSGDSETGGPGRASNASSKQTPWTLGLSRSLGGGATLKFEHSDPDSKTAKSSSALWLQVNF